jgi:hypothetical protein
MKKNNNIRVLCIYESTQTYTSTVFEHVNSFQKYSNFSWDYIDHRDFSNKDLSISSYQIIVVHYSVRLPFLQLSQEAIVKLNKFKGIKALFIQDEYDHTNKAKETIKRVGFQLVFTVVPQNSIELIYPSNEFPGVKFINNLTGYVPDSSYFNYIKPLPPSARGVVVAYRARTLPVRYGKLGQEKVKIGQIVKGFCEENYISNDISWKEEDRIYGDAWYPFLTSCKSMLGSESGSNVFDWNGDLQQLTDKYVSENPKATQTDIYRSVISSFEIDGVMNQISPRVFEMIAARTVMILFNGDYSNVLIPNEHYIPLNKDFSNINEVFEKLQDGSLLDLMVTKAYEDIILSGKYSYKNFVAMVDEGLSGCIDSHKIKLAQGQDDLGLQNKYVHSKPIKASLTNKPLSKNISTFNLGIGKFEPQVSVDMGNASNGTQQIGWYNGPTLGYGHIFGQRNSAALCITQGYQASPLVDNGFQSSISSTWAKTAISLDHGSIRFFSDEPNTFARGAEINPTERMRIVSTGNIGVGLSNPSERLHVMGNVLAAGQMAVYADKRLIKHKSIIKNPLDIILGINGYSYIRSDDGSKRMGVVAQELESAIPEAIIDNGEVKAVSYDSLVALLVEVVKTQQREIDLIKGQFTKELAHKSGCSTFVQRALYLFKKIVQRAIYLFKKIVQRAIYLFKKIMQRAIYLFKKIMQRTLNHFKKIK